MVSFNGQNVFPFAVKKKRFSRIFGSLILAKDNVRNVQVVAVISVSSLKIYGPENKLIFRSASSLNKDIHVDLLM